MKLNAMIGIRERRIAAPLAAATCPVVVFCHQRLDGTGSYFVKNAAEVRRIIDRVEQA